MDVWCHLTSQTPLPGSPPAQAVPCWSSLWVMGRAPAPLPSHGDAVGALPSWNPALTQQFGADGPWIQGDPSASAPWNVWDVPSSLGAAQRKAQPIPSQAGMDFPKSQASRPLILSKTLLPKRSNPRKGCSHPKSRLPALYTQPGQHHGVFPEPTQQRGAGGPWQCPCQLCSLGVRYLAAPGSRLHPRPSRGSRRAGERPRSLPPERVPMAMRNQLE